MQDGVQGPHLSTSRTAGLTPRSDLVSRGDRLVARDLLSHWEQMNQAHRLAASFPFLRNAVFVTVSLGSSLQGRRLL